MTTSKFSTTPAGNEELVGIFSYGNIPGLTGLTLNHTTSLGGFSFSDMTELLTLDFPNLETIDPSAVQSGGLSVSAMDTVVSCPVLTTIGGSLIIGTIGWTAIDSQFPSLVTVGSQIVIISNSSLESISFPELITANFIGLVANPLLTTVSLPKWVPTNGVSVDAKGGGAGLGSALNQASVDHILARCVANASLTSGTIHLDGDACAAPSAQGQTDAATLTGRGVDVFVN